MPDSMIPVPTEWKTSAFMDGAAYRHAYARSLSDPDGYWREQAGRLS